VVQAKGTAAEAVTAAGVVHAFLYADRLVRDLNSMIDPPLRVHVPLISGNGTNDDGLIVNWRRLTHGRDAHVPVE